MADGKLYVIVTDNPQGQGGGRPDKPPSDPNKPDEEKGETKSLGGVLASYVIHQMLNEAKQVAKQGINFAISNIGNYTGNYVMQEKMAETVNRVENAVGYGMAALAGGKMGSFAGPVGAVAGAAIAMGVKAITSGINNAITNQQQLLAFKFQMAQQQKYQEILRERSGIDSSWNGSTGTYY